MKKITSLVIILFASVQVSNVFAQFWPVGTCAGSYMYTYQGMDAYINYFNFTATAKKSDGTTGSFYKTWTPPYYNPQPYGEITLYNPSAQTITLYITTFEDNNPVAGDPRLWAGSSVGNVIRLDDDHGYGLSFGVKVVLNANAEAYLRFGSYNNRQGDTYYGVAILSSNPGFDNYYPIMTCTYQQDPVFQYDN